MTFRRQLLVLASCAPLVLTAACGGSDVPMGPDDGVPTNPSFSQHVNPIFTAQGCTAGGCHGTGTAGLTLTASASSNYANLVNVSSSDPQHLLVEPNDAENSYLVMKVEGRAPGERMPYGLPPLSSDQIATIRNWIDSGAPNN